MHTHTNLLSLKLNKVAMYVHLRRALHTGFSGLRRWWLIGVARRQVERAVGGRLARAAVQRWKVEYMRMDVGRRVMERRHTVVKYKCFRGIRDKTKEMRWRRVRGERIEAKKNGKRIIRAWQAFKLYKNIARKN